VLRRSLLVALATLASPAAASGSFTTVQWELTSCPYVWDARNAPVNLVFYGNATGATSQTFFLAHLAWPNTDITTRSDQSGGNCGPSDWKQASLPASIDVGTGRYMIQARHTASSDAKWGQTVVSSVRRQIRRTASCYAVAPATATSSSGYDNGRKKVYGALVTVPSVGFTSVYWGNTATVHQCDGRNAGSNGWVYWFRVA